MKQNLFARYTPTIRDLEICDLDDRLLLDRDGPVSVYYAPFDYINGDAKIVIAGITPGKTQMFNALREARKQLLNGASNETALEAAKQTASVSGAMRPNLINLLDYIGVNKWLRINTCGGLFDDSTKLVQTTSVLRFPVFIDGSNYNGTPNMLKHALLRRHFLEHFGAEATLLKNALLCLSAELSSKHFDFWRKKVSSTTSTFWMGCRIHPEPMPSASHTSWARNQRNDCPQKLTQKNWMAPANCFDRAYWRWPIERQQMKNIAPRQSLRSRAGNRNREIIKATFGGLN